VFRERVYGAASSAVVEIDLTYRRRVLVSLIVAQLHLPQSKPAFFPTLTCTQQRSCFTSVAHRRVFFVKAIIAIFS